MFELGAQKSCLSVTSCEPLVSGAVEIYTAKFSFSADWTDLERTAVFSAGGVKISVLLGADNTCMIPWEVLAKPRVELHAGVYGTKDGTLVLPTIWASLGVIQRGTSPGQDTRPPTPTVYEQLLSEIGNLNELNTEAKNSLVSAINELWESGGGGGISSPDISTIRVMDLADYDALETKDGRTLYLIRG